MITYKKGDILKALEDNEIDVFAHGVNCSNGFGSGIAGQIAKKYPSIKEKFHSDSAHNFDTLGFALPYFTDDGLIFNCYTQEEYGSKGIKYVSYDAIEESLRIVYGYCKLRSLNLGLPKIGCGLAGGNWNIVEAIINEVFKDMEVTVYEYQS